MPEISGVTKFKWTAGHPVETNVSCLSHSSCRAREMTSPIMGNDFLVPAKWQLTFISFISSIYRLSPTKWLQQPSNFALWPQPTRVDYQSTLTRASTRKCHLSGVMVQNVYGQLVKTMSISSRCYSQQPHMIFDLLLATWLACRNGVPPSRSRCRREGPLRHPELIHWATMSSMTSSTLLVLPDLTYLGISLKIMENPLISLRSLCSRSSS